MSAIETFTDRAGYVLVFVVLPLTGVIVYEVVMRYVFHLSTVWATELSKYLFGGYTILLAAYALLHNRHVRVDILRERLSPRRKAVVDLATSVLGFTFIILLLRSSVQWAWLSVQRGEISTSAWSPPIYPVKLLLPIATAWFLLQMVVTFIRLYTLFKGTQQDGGSVK